MNNKELIKIYTHGYFFLTIIGVFLLLFGVDYHYIQLFGCHTTYYAFLVALLLGDIGFIILARICLILWPVYVAALLISYLIAAIKRKYTPLAVIAMSDALLSMFVSVRFFRCAAYGDGFLSFMGVVCSLLTAVGLFRCARIDRNRKSEQTWHCE